jgi:hypothetical protein
VGWYEVRPLAVKNGEKVGRMRRMGSMGGRFQILEFQISRAVRGEDVSGVVMRRPFRASE